MEGQQAGVTGWIDISDVIVPQYHRALKPWALERLTRSMRDHGYNIAYPITLDGQNTLVDGRHRLEAAKELGIARVPWVKKPDSASPIRFALQCNADGQLSAPDDVFDLAELCYGLAQQGWSGEQIAKELGWDRTAVVHYSQIKECLHPEAWRLARSGVTRNGSLVTEPDQDVVLPEVTIVNWRESHFRSLLRHLPCADRHRGTMRAQIAVLKEALKRWNSDKKVTAKWIEEVAMRYAWHLKLKRYATEHLVREVGIGDRKVLFKNINNDVFGREKSDRNQEKFSQAVSLLNEKALGVRLYWDDVLQRIPRLKDGSIALVIADPPYNVTDAPWDRFRSPEEYLEWTELWLETLRPKLARDYHLFLFCDPSYMCRIENLLVQHGWPIKSRIIWAYRNLSMGRDVADRFISCWQPIFHCGTHPLNWSPDWSDERFDVQLHATPQSNFEDKKHHPMAKPVKLIELFVRVGSKPGDIVLDPFAGGGVTGEACSTVKQRRCLLIEKEEEFVATIERRLGINRVKEGDDG
jgi:DNA modification methylase